jgi:hypothetical protein
MDDRMKELMRPPDPNKTVADCLMSLGYEIWGMSGVIDESLPPAFAELRWSESEWLDFVDVIDNPYKTNYIELRWFSSAL